MPRLTKGRYVIVFLACCLGSWMLAEAQDEKSSTGNSELERATETVKNITAASPDKGIPKDVLQGAKCVAVIPKLVKGAFVVGGEHGSGVATCKTSDNNWSPPAPFSVSGASFGPQIGGKSTDLMMFIMNDEGMNGLMKGHVKLGADVSAAVGPWDARLRPSPDTKPVSDLLEQQGRVHRRARCAAGSHRLSRSPIAVLHRRTDPHHV